MLASQSKLLTTVAALKCVEQGYIKLDDDVAPHLPELARLKIFMGFDGEGAPILKERAKTITLRHLLTHTSGTNYAFTPDMQQYQKVTGRDTPQYTRAPTIAERCNIPLQFEPGEGWMYGYGLDWASLLIERLTGENLEEYERKNLWEPLGVTGITFWAHKNPELKTRIPQVVVRGEDGRFAPKTEQSSDLFATDSFGGQAMYAQLSDYLKVQQSLLANDGALLMPESVDELFRPQLEGAALKACNDMMRLHKVMFMNELNSEIPVNHALGGMVLMQDDVGRRKSGTLTWGGMYNSFWSIDREAGVAMTFGIELLPSGDAGSREMWSLAERVVYELAAVHGRGV